MTLVKICGIRDEAALRAAAEAGADWVGFVLVEGSPRRLPWRTALRLATDALGTSAKPVFVTSGRHPAHALGAGVGDLMAVQMHGDEPPGEVELVTRRSVSEVIKAIGVATRADLSAAEQHPTVSRLLIDAKPPVGSPRAGGHGATFDWSILQGWRAPKPWILAGGLTPDTVADAIRASGAAAVDVSSGVESAPGVKDPIKIRDFIHAAKGAGSTPRAAE